MYFILSLIKNNKLIIIEIGNRERIINIFGTRFRIGNRNGNENENDRNYVSMHRDQIERMINRTAVLAIQQFLVQFNGMVQGRNAITIAERRRRMVEIQRRLTELLNQD